MGEKKLPVCDHCGSSKVVFDAWAAWNTEMEMHVLDETFDNTYCHACGETNAGVTWVAAEAAQDAP